MIFTAEDRAEMQYVADDFAVLAKSTDLKFEAWERYIVRAHQAWLKRNDVQLAFDPAYNAQVGFKLFG